MIVGHVVPIKHGSFLVISNQKWWCPRCSMIFLITLGILIYCQSKWWFFLLLQWHFPDHFPWPPISVTPGDQWWAHRSRTAFPPADNGSSHSLPTRAVIRAVEHGQDQGENRGDTWETRVVEVKLQLVPSKRLEKAWSTNLGTVGMEFGVVYCWVNTTLHYATFGYPVKSAFWLLGPCFPWKFNNWKIWLII